MKRPKKIKIVGVTYTIEYSKTLNGGMADARAQKIVVGVDARDDRIENTLLHECIESALVERRFHYDKHDSGATSGIFYMFDHQQLEALIIDIQEIITQLYPQEK